MAKWQRIRNKKDLPNNKVYRVFVTRRWDFTGENDTTEEAFFMGRDMGFESKDAIKLNNVIAWRCMYSTYQRETVEDIESFNDIYK